MIGIDVRVLTGLEAELLRRYEVKWEGMTFMWHEVARGEIVVTGKIVDDDYPFMLASLVTYFAAMICQHFTDEEPAEINVKYSFTPETREFVVRAVTK